MGTTISFHQFWFRLCKLHCLISGDRAQIHKLPQDLIGLASAAGGRRLTANHAADTQSVAVPKKCTRSTSLRATIIIYSLSTGLFFFTIAESQHWNWNLINCPAQARRWKKKSDLVFKIGPASLFGAASCFSPRINGPFKKKKERVEMAHSLDTIHISTFACIIRVDLCSRQVDQTWRLALLQSVSIDLFFSGRSISLWQPLCLHRQQWRQQPLWITFKVQLPK